MRKEMDGGVLEETGGREGGTEGEEDGARA